MRVAVLGSRGMIGRHYMEGLKNHPWFEVIDDPNQCDLVFSALPKDAEPKFDKPVISSSSHHRLKKEVPLIIPEVNAHHLEIVRGKKAFVVAKPNCSLQSYLLPLTPLHRAFEVTKIHVTLLQAKSGGGKKALDNPHFVENIVPYIPDEEIKSEQEPQKIWQTSNIKISATCMRVPVVHGHLASVSVSFKVKPTEEAILTLWKTFPGLDLPSAPKQVLHYEEDPTRPQPRLDCNREKGMGITLGRLRPCPLLDFRFIALSHNAIRGGAGGGILIAEHLYKEGYLG
ncbi:MAG: Aspartate-semialdehyde dehydrogenase [Chlamydiales bacterium]|nr:Aspartate-semialdehyde dehydrogenase [Chlamydiales bacterium]MCH9620224.1 Aspartate-semialdehyde dehydrogenase [Chlamydiales bacterium]MCH9623061.1 Aspartate-semialdehyde dehydrogenase [Chlamydiales bacterium]